MNRAIALVLGAVLALSACQKAATPPQAGTAATSSTAGSAPAAAVTAERLLNAAAEGSQWMTYGRTYDEQRFSPLKQVDTSNVGQLGLAWFADYDTNMQQTGTPLYIDGVLYVSTAWSKVYAFDARTGKTLWQYQPRVPGEWAQKVCCGLVNRGIAAFNGRIYVGTLDARLVALDAKTGKEVWSTMTITGDTSDPLNRFSITMAPRVAKGKVFVGASGGEFGVRGWIAAFDAETGKEVWRFFTVPDAKKPPENEWLRKARATWGDEGAWTQVGGGGTVWDAAVYDPQTDLLFFGTGNGTPWNQRDRDPSGKDNLYLTSIIAVRPDTGEYVWHYQTTPADNWDYDATSPMMIADLTIDGTQRHVLMQPCKNGFFYVLDAKTGELLRAVPFTEVNWAKGVDRKTGRPIELKEARYSDGKPFNGLPGAQGGHGWHSNAFNPELGLIYIPTQHAYFPWVEDPKYKPGTVGYNLGIDFGAQFTYYRANPNAPQGFEGMLKAWDPVAGKEVWRSQTNQGPTGGALATAGGLVFQGAGASGEFRAFDAKTGQKLWTFAAQTGVLPGPISYELDGKQYIAASVGGNQQGGYYAPNYSRMLVFTLGGTQQLPPVTPYTPPPLAPPPATASVEAVNAGRADYSMYCAACHGENGQTRGATFPDLTRSAMLHSQQAFDAVVLQGVLKERGMASFANALQPADSADIRAFIVARANELKNAPQLGPPGAQPAGQPPPPRDAHEQR